MFFLCIFRLQVCVFVFGDVPVMLLDYIFLRYFCFSVSLIDFLFVDSDLNSIIIISA